MATTVGPTDNPNMNTYLIPTDTIATATKALTTAARSITGLRFEFSQSEVKTRRVYDIVEAAHGQMQQVLRAEFPIEVSTLTIEFPDFAHNGWTILAKREHSQFEYITRDLDSRIAAKSFSESLTDGQCDHCHKAIKRNEVFIIANETEMKQVGGKCASYYVPVELRRAIRALAIALAEVTKMSDEEGFGSFRSTKWVNFSNLTHAVDNAKDMAFVPSKDRYDNPNSDATWRKVTQHAQDMIIIDGREVCQSVVDTIQNAGQKFTDELEMVTFNGEWITRRDAAYFVTLHHRARQARPASGVALRMAEEGRQLITGIVLSMKKVESAFGVTVKILVEATDGGLKFWGSNPQGAYGIGDEVSFIAAVTPKEPGFAFYKNPRLTK